MKNRKKSENRNFYFFDFFQFFYFFNCSIFSKIATSQNTLKYESVSILWKERMICEKPNSNKRPFNVLLPHLIAVPNHFKFFKNFRISANVILDYIIPGQKTGILIGQTFLLVDCFRWSIPKLTCNFSALMKLPKMMMLKSFTNWNGHVSSWSLPQILSSRWPSFWTSQLKSWGSKRKRERRSLRRKRKKLKKPKVKIKSSKNESQSSKHSFKI